MIDSKQQKGIIISLIFPSPLPVFSAIFYKYHNTVTYSLRWVTFINLCQKVMILCVIYITWTRNLSKKFSPVHFNVIILSLQSSGRRKTIKGHGISATTIHIFTLWRRSFHNWISMHTAPTTSNTICTISRHGPW